LLRVLQTRQFQRLGDTEPRAFRGRIVTATNRDLAAEIRAGRFREDFFFRLCADRIETPALHTMLEGDPEELRCLVSHICAAQAGAREEAELTAQVVAWIEKELGRGYAWPGNFRELEQCVRNIVVHGDYRPPLAMSARANGSDWADDARAGKLTMDQLLHHYCRTVVADAGTLEEAARRLAADRRTVRRYLRGAVSSAS
jgi:DNA-binding NtrC family response regulator